VAVHLPPPMGDRAAHGGGEVRPASVPEVVPAAQACGGVKGEEPRLGKGWFDLPRLGNQNPPWDFSSGFPSNARIHQTEG